jgi:hypothetical protein
MQKDPLFGICIITTVLLVLGSLTNVVGYQMVQSLNKKIIKDNIDQKELLFKTIIDIANNKEIQNIIQKSESKGVLKRFLQESNTKLLLMKIKMRFNVFLPSPPFLTKRYLEYVNNMSLRLFKIFDTSKIHSILEQFRVDSQMIQKEIVAVIEKNNELNKKIEQLSDLPCECEKDKTTIWSFPVICTFLVPLFIFALVLGIKFQIYWPMNIIILIGTILNCFWPHL